jgi:hypothetical protein
MKHHAASEIASPQMETKQVLVAGSTLFHLRFASSVYRDGDPARLSVLL